MTFQNKLGFLSVATYIALCLLYNFASELVEVMVLLFCLLFIPSFTKKRKNYELTKYSLYTGLCMLIISGTLSLLLKDQNDGIIKEYLYYLPTILLGSSISLEIINKLNNRPMKLFYLHFVMVGSLIGWILYKESWMQFYIYYWLLIEMSTFCLLMFFNIKIPFLKKLYQSFNL